MVTLSFAAGASDAFVDALNHQPGFPADEFGVRYHIETHVTETIGEMKGGKWMAYAARALIVRFWELTRVSSPNILCHVHVILTCNLESGFTGHLARSRRLHSHACVIHSLVLLSARTWFQLEAQPCNLVIIHPRIHARSPHLALPGDSFRSN